MTKRKGYLNDNDWEDLTEEFAPEESDRVIAIVSAAFLDARLEQLIASFLIDEENQVKELLEPERPLGSFGARTRAAYCLGLISKDEYHDLKIIQRVRNDFAHKLSLSFTDNSIRDRCNALKLPRKSPGPFQIPPSIGPRDSFKLATILLGLSLESRAYEAQQERRVVPSKNAIDVAIEKKTSHRT